MTSILKVSEIQDVTNSNTALTIDSAGVVSFNASTPKVFTAVSEQTASGNSVVDFTNIPSGINLIKFTGWNVSPSTTATIDIRIGDSGGFETTGYAIQSHYGNSGLAAGGHSTSANSWTNYAWNNDGNHFYYSGEIVHAGGNKWIMDTRCFIPSYSDFFITTMGYKELSGELDRIRFFPTAGTFDSGSFRVMYA